MAQRSSRPIRIPSTALDQFMYLVQGLHDAQCRCLLAFGGEIDTSRMDQAVQWTLDAEPVLRCRFVEHPWRPYWFGQEDSADARGSAVLVSDPEGAAAHAFLVEPLDPTRDPLVQVRIFRHRARPSGDLLAVKLSHVAGDAGGLLDYVGRLARAYRSLGEGRARPRAPARRSSRGTASVLRAVGPRELLRACQAFRLPRSAWGIPATGADITARTFAVRNVPPSRLKAIDSYRAGRSCSMNDVLLAAFHRAMAGVLSPTIGVPLPIEMTVDLRRHLLDRRPATVTNLASAYFPAISWQPGEAFDQTLARVSRAAARAKVDQPWLGATVGLEVAFAFPFGLVRRVATSRLVRETAGGNLHPFFANLGVLSPQRFDFGQPRVEVVEVFGPVPYPPGSLLSVATFKGTMTATVGYSPTATDPSLVESILDSFVHELPG